MSVVSSPFVPTKSPISVKHRRWPQPKSAPTVWFSQRPGTHTQCGHCGLPLVTSYDGTLECGACGYLRSAAW